MGASDDEEANSDSSRETQDTVYSTSRHKAAVHVKKAARVVEEAPPRPRSRATSDTRQPGNPYLARNDIGTFSVYQGNWGGRSKHAETRHHIYWDIVIKSPSHIICAQEVAPEFVEVLEHPRSRSEWKPEQPKWLTAEDARRLRMAEWIVAQGDEGPGSSRMDGTCIIAAHASMAVEVNLLEWILMRDGTYTDKVGRKGNKRTVQKMALSRILVAQIVWKHPMKGKAATVVATTHLNRITAKGKRGMKAARDKYFEVLTRVLQEHKAEVLTGDFNMALLLVVPRLRRANLPAELISWYAFRATSGFQLTPVGEPSTSDYDDARGGAAAAVAARTPARVKLESVAIICLKRLYKIQSEMSLENWDDPEKLHLFHKEKGPGYVIGSYVGGDKALRESLKRLKSLEAPRPINPEAAAVVAQVKTQTAKGKLLQPEKWDAPNRLFEADGHMPLLAFFGDGKSGRKEDKLVKREQAATARGWGPEPGSKRSALMQAQGMGPPPGHEAFLERKARRQQRQQAWSSRSWGEAAPAAAPAGAGEAACAAAAEQAWSRGWEGWGEQQWAAPSARWCQAWDETQWRSGRPRPSSKWDEWRA